MMGISAAEAAAIAGVQRKRINQACRSGQIKARKVPGYRMPEWELNAKSFYAWLDGRHRRNTEHRPWTDADLAALMELASTCGVRQVADYLGRSVLSVKMKRSALRHEGVITVPRRWQRYDPMVLPKSGILLAKTCTACGELRDAVYYDKAANRDRNHRNECRICRGKRSTNHNKASEKREQLLAATRASASNAYRRYDGAEIEALRDTSKTSLELAGELGRSLQAVMSQRHKLGVTTKPRRPALPDSAWDIEFPAAAAALQEHYRALGASTPEARYGIDPGWADEVAS